jgi:hypothetical protein
MALPFRRWSVTGVGGSLRDHLKVYTPALGVGCDDAHADGIPQTVDAVCAAPAQEMRAFGKLVEVIVEGGHVHETFDKPVGELHEEAEGVHAADEAWELRADLILHELHLLEVDHFSFGLHGDSFALGGGLRNGRQARLPCRSAFR